MKIAFDGTIMKIQPDGVNWEPPQVVGRDGDFAPVRGQFYSCRLSFGHLTTVSFYDWHQIFNTQGHTITLPHPFTGQMTDFCCYVDSITPRHDVSDQSDNCAVMGGMDVTLSGIVIPPVPAYPFSFSFCPE